MPLRVLCASADVADQAHGNTTSSASPEFMPPAARACFSRLKSALRVLCGRNIPLAPSAWELRRCVSRGAIDIDLGSDCDSGGASMRVALLSVTLNRAHSELSGLPAATVARHAFTLALVGTLISARVRTCSGGAQQ